MLLSPVWELYRRDKATGERAGRGGKVVQVPMGLFGPSKGFLWFSMFIADILQGPVFFEGIRCL